MQVLVHVQKVSKQAVATFRHVNYSNLSNVLQHQRKVSQEQRFSPVVLKQEKNAIVKYLV